MREAVVAVLRRGDRVLVIRRGPLVVMPGYWTPLSGRIEPGETQRDAVAREVYEEIGLRVTPTAKVWECPTDDGGFLLHWWTVEIEPDHLGSDRGSDQLVLDPAEVSDARWVTAAEFRELRPTFAGDHEFIERVLPQL